MRRIDFGQNVVVWRTWSSLKAVAASKGLKVQCETTADRHFVFAVDGVIVYWTEIYLGAVPEGTRTADGAVYSAEDCANDKSDFETNYLATANDNAAVTVIGAVAIAPPVVPTACTPKVIYADSPLKIDDDHTTSYDITSGKTFTVQEVVVGAGGDPSEKGVRIDVVFFDGTTEHVILRVYVTAWTIIVPLAASTARDGTALVGGGSGSTTHQIRVKRIPLSGRDKDVDVVVRGYEA